MNFRQVARSIVMGLEDHKWYQNEARIVAALRDAYSAGAEAQARRVPPSHYSVDHWRTQADGDSRGGTVTEVGQG